ncbi:MAG: P-loop NTPase [Oscillospiraceae bacterium]|nr:P-loop NTPase [Oscillospiraceae bacterium]
MQQRIAVISGKGGVGKSTISACLAVEMAARGKRVLLVDCDIGLRSLDMILGVDEHVLFSWADAALGRCTVKQAVLPFGGIHLLCAPVADEDTLEEDALAQLITTCSDYDVVILDAPAGIGFGYRCAVLAADRALVVCTADPVCVRSAALAGTKALRMDLRDVRLVINRFDRKVALQRRHLAIDEIIDQTELQLIGVVPQQSQLFFQTSNANLLEANLVTQAVAQIASRLGGENIPLIIPNAE